MRGLFFNAQPTTDIMAHPSGFDREYDNDDFNRYMGVFFGNGIFVREDADACKVTASGLRLDVTPGIALLDGGQCHFEPGDGLTISQGDGLYSVMCRRNNAAAVRAFELVAIKGVEAYPAPVREGDIYDLCLAHVQVAGGVATVTDTREDGELCGFAALTGQPPYYPPDEANLPYILWLYVLGLPMTPEQKAAVESNPSLMEIFEQSRIVQATRTATKEEAEAGVDNSKLMTPRRTKEAVDKAVEAIYTVGDVKTTIREVPSSDWLPCNGATLLCEDYPELDLAAGYVYRSPRNTRAQFATENSSNHLSYWDRATDKFLFYLARISNSAKLYSHNLITNTGAVLDNSLSGYPSALISVQGSDYTLYLRISDSSATCGARIINPAGEIAARITITLLATAPSGEKFVARLSDPNTIQLYSFNSTTVRRYDFTISSNTVSSTDVTVSGVAGSIYSIALFEDELYFSSGSQGTKIYKKGINPLAGGAVTEVALPSLIDPTSGTYLRTDEFGNMFVTGSSSNSYIGVYVKGEGFFRVPNLYGSLYPGRGVVWFRDKGYGAIISDSVLIRFNKTSFVTDSITGDGGLSQGIGSYFQSSGATAFISRYGMDIVLPTIKDATNRGYANIKVK